MKDTAFRSIIVAAQLCAFTVPAIAQLVVTQDLGVQTPGTPVNLMGDTATGMNNADRFGNTSNTAANWGNELVYQFEITERAIIDVTLNAVTGDPDFILLDGLGTIIDALGKRATTNDIAPVFLDVPPPATESLGAHDAGVYYLCATTFHGFDGALVPADSTYDITVTFTALGGTPTDALDLGTIVSAGAPFQIDSNGSVFDTELGLYDSLGNLILSDDDGGVGTQSLLDLAAGLDEGEYYVALGGFNTEFGATNWEVLAGAAAGSAILNYPNGSEEGLVVSGLVQWFVFQVGSASTPPSDPIDLGILAADAGEPFSLSASGALPGDLGLFTAFGTVLADGGGSGNVINLPGLPSGFYYLALAEFDSTFDTGFAATPPGTAGGGWTLTYPVGSESGTLAVGGVQWFLFELVTPPPSGIDLGVLADSGEAFQIDTNGSPIDTELGLYDSDGNLLQDDDDGGEGTQSLLDIAGLPAGIYYLALGEFNTAFGETEWAVSGGDTAGDWTLNYPGGLRTGALTVAEVQWFTFTIGSEGNAFAPPVIGFSADRETMDTMMIEWDSSVGETFSVQSGIDGINWVTIEAGIVPDGPTTQRSYKGDWPGRRLFRVVGFLASPK